MVLNWLRGLTWLLLGLRHELRVQEYHAAVHDLQVVCHVTILEVRAYCLELWEQGLQFVLCDLDHEADVHSLLVLGCDHQVSI